MSADAVHFRHSQTTWLAALVAFIGALPVASLHWFLTPILLVPLAVVIWGWRSGTNADRTGLRLRGLVGTRRITWSEITELSTDGRGRAVARLTGGRLITLPGVRGSDLPRLVAASGQPLDRAAGAEAAARMTDERPEPAADERPARTTDERPEPAADGRTKPDAAQ